MKRIVICSDGTWNTPDAEGEGTPTNVARLAGVVPAHDDAGVEQLTYYGTGVGTRGNRLKRWIAGATGWGLSDNLLDAYRFVVAHYEPGDELFLFGFSRGAFTVRSLGGLINNSGILRPVHADHVGDAFDLYRSRSAESHPRRAESVLFRKSFAWQDRTPIRCIGVWDTVGALGNPLFLMKSPLSRRFHFHDTDLSSTVENAFHAMAIDEKRRHFRVTRWHKQDDSADQTVEQRWFIGVHSDVGGGTRFAGLSDISLEWMIRRAGALGLKLDLPALSPDWQVGPGRSRKGLYRLIPRHHRPIAEQPAAETCEVLDESVERRYAGDEDYRPPNLVDYHRRTGRD